MYSIAPCHVTGAPDGRAAGRGIGLTGPDRGSQKHLGDVNLIGWENREVTETGKQEKELDWGIGFILVTSKGEELKLSRGLLLRAASCIHSFKNYESSASFRKGGHKTPHRFK